MSSTIEYDLDGPLITIGGFRLRIYINGILSLEDGILDSCYGAHFMHLEHPANGNITDRVWKALCSDIETSRYISGNRDRIMLHTTDGLTDDTDAINDMRSHYIVISGGPKELAEFLVNIISREIGDNEIRV